MCSECNWPLEKAVKKDYLTSSPKFGNRYWVIDDEGRKFYAQYTLHGWLKINLQDEDNLTLVFGIRWFYE